MFQRALPIIIILGAAATAFAADSPDLTDARVTIPYSELKSLWTAAQQQQQSPEASRPPVDATLVSARYQLTFKDDRALGTVEFQAQAFTNRWTVLPLIGTGAQIESIDPPDAQVIVQGGDYALVTDRPGKQTVKIQFAAKLGTNDDRAHLHLPIAPASINTLVFTGIPQHQAPKVADAVEVSRDQDSATFQLAAQDHVDVDLFTEKSLAPPAPSQWKLDPQAFVQLSDGKLMYDVRLAASADAGAGLAMDLELPADANISNITGDDLLEWHAAAGDDGSRVAHLRWKTRDILRREVRMTYDLPQPLTAAEWKLQSPQATGGHSSPPMYIVALPTGLELTVPPETPVPRQMPGWMAERAAAVNFLALVGDPPIQARWLPVVQTARAVVQSAHAKLQVVADGSAMTELDYNVQHESALAWKLDLPAGSELLSCSVDGAAVNPINRGGHLIEFTLPHGRSLDQVRLTYTTKVAAFKPVSGSVDLELPQTDLLISELSWEAHIPPAYEVTAFDGNVEPAGNSDTDSNSRVIHLHRSLCEGQRPAAQLFYQKSEASK